MCKWAPSLVFDPIDEMSLVMAGLFDDLKEECRSCMLHDNMNISRLMVHYQQVEKTRVKRKSRVDNRVVVIQRIGLI